MKTIVIPLVIAGFFIGCTSSMLYEKMDYWDQKKYDDIQYIASKQERMNYLEIHKSQRKAFLKDFWRRRDPTPDTLINEFKIEHYRRLAYANKYFGISTFPGWKTDRGWIYIKYGPPDQIERNPAGSIGPDGWHSPPYEVWSYDYAPGLSMNAKMVFVDRFFTGDYKQVGSLNDVLSDPWGRSSASEGISNYDAESSGGGFGPPMPTTISQQRAGKNYDYMQKRIASREQRRFIDEIADETSKAKKKDVTVPEIHIFVKAHRFLADKGRLFVQFDYQVPYTDLKFLDMPEGNYRATLYIGTELQKGRDSYMVGQVQRDIYTDTYEETINPHAYLRYSTGAIVHPGEYVLRVSLRDPVSGWIAYYSEMVSVNPFGDDFNISSIELASEIVAIESDVEDPFRKYNWRVVPNPTASYPQGSNLALYFEIYNLTLNEDNRHEYFTEYTIFPADDPKEIILHEKFHTVGAEGNIHSIQAYTPKLEEGKFPPGDYKIEIRVTDLITKKEVITVREFTVLSRM